MERTFESKDGRVRTALLLPDGVPEEVEAKIDIDFHAETEEQARAAIEAFGGIGSFETIAMPVAGGQHEYLHLRGHGFGAKFQITLWVPSGEERRTMPPFLAELKQEQDAAEKEREAQVARDEADLGPDLGGTAGKMGALDRG